MFTRGHLSIDSVGSSLSWFMLARNESVVTNRFLTISLDLGGVKSVSVDIKGYRSFLSGRNYLSSKFTFIAFQMFSIRAKNLSF